MAYHRKSFLRLNLLSNYQFSISDFTNSNFFFKFPIFSSNFQCFPSFRSFYKFCQAQPSFNLSLAEAELVILSINPTTHPPLSGKVVSSSNSSNYVNTNVSMLVSRPQKQFNLQIATLSLNTSSSLSLGLNFS